MRKEHAGIIHSSGVLTIIVKRCKRYKPPQKSGQLIGPLKLPQGLNPYPKSRNLYTVEI
jgi:hypothetical protein